MFSKCCGYNKKNSKKIDSGKLNDIKIFVNNDIQVSPKEHSMNNEVSVKLSINNETPLSVRSLIPVSTDVTNELNCEHNNSHACFEMTEVNVDSLKPVRVLIDGDVIEDEEEVDEVFGEGENAAPPMPLCMNLATHYASKRHSAPGLPRWFSEEDDVETGGTQEPPATPIGRDEVALRRHRFFSELMTAAQAEAATEHRVRFNPLGPVVAGGVDCDIFNYHKATAELETLIVRLEKVATRLEDSLGVTAGIVETATTTMSVAGFQEILNGPFAVYINLSQTIGGDVATQSQIVQKAFNAQLQYLNIASTSKAPSQSEQMALLQPTSEQISAIQNFREKNRTSVYFNHLSAISESITALGWVTVTPAPSPFVKEMKDAGLFYTNRVLNEWKEKDKKHVEWVKSWIQTLNDLQQYVKQHHTTGLVWSGKGSAAVPPPPPPGSFPPPPPMLSLDELSLGDANNDRSALFAQINQGEDITKSLKKVTSDMQTHKNPILRTGPAPFKAPANTSQMKSVAASTPVEKQPSFVRDGKKWLIEYQKGNKNLLVENAEMNNVIYVYKCVESTITVKGKINSIVLDSCKKTSVVFDSLVSSIEFINCQSTQMQVLGKVPTVSIDKTDGCQIFLSKDSLDVEVISSKSTEMNIMVPKSNGDYAEYPVPEQYKTMVLPTGKGLHTEIIENKG